MGAISGTLTSTYTVGAGQNPLTITPTAGVVTPATIAVQATVDATIVNAGVITAIAPTATGNHAAGVTLLAGGTVTNAGSIEGATGIYSVAGTTAVTNAGMIDG